MEEARPLLTIAIPTRDRPELFERALRSVVRGARPDSARAVEVVVSDNASDAGDGRSEAVATRLLTGWPGPSRYVRHWPSVGMVDNFNACVTAASGEHLLILHDDDHLLPGGLDRAVDVLASTGHDITLFGVHVVDADGKRLRRQTFRRRRYLPPPDALRRVLTNSSFVRFPGLAVRRGAYEQAGPFDSAVGGATDFDMWARLFSRFGVHCSDQPVAAYTVHPGAATTSTFTPATVANIGLIFERARSAGVLDDRAVRRCRSHFLHQFILGGAYRSIRARDRDGAERVLALFDLPDVRAAGPSLRWLPVRLVFAVVVRFLRAPREPTAPG